jgi:hypothetical protein
MSLGYHHLLHSIYNRLQFLDRPVNRNGLFCSPFKEIFACCSDVGLELDQKSILQYEIGFSVYPPSFMIVNVKLMQNSKALYRTRALALNKLLALVPLPLVLVPLIMPGG